MLPAHIEFVRYFIRKNRKKARKFLAKFLKVEVRLALTILSEGLDLATDIRFLTKNILQLKPEDRVCTISCLTGLQYMLRRSEQEAISSLVTPWIIFFAIAVVASVVATLMKLKVFYQQLRLARCAHQITMLE